MGTRKNSVDPMSCLSEVQKKSKFCEVYSVMDECIECHNCKEIVKVNPEDENATEKYILQVFYRGVNHNEFLAYICDKLGRTGAKPSFDEVNKLWLHYTASSRLDYKNSNNSKIRKADTRRKSKQSDYCYTYFLKGHKSNICKNAPGKEWNLDSKKTFTKPEWWDDKPPNPADSKTIKKKKVKKCTEKELEDALKNKESSESDNNENPSSEEDSKSDVVDKKIKRAST